jgi:hypothetical protein
MNYSEVLSRAWQIVWRHKALWIFGILSGCSTAGGGNMNFNNRQDAPQSIQNYFESIPQETLVLIFVGIGIAVLLLIVIAVFLGTIGKIGLVRGSVQADDDFETRLNFGKLFKGSLPYFWRVILLNLVVSLGIFAVIAMLIAGGVAATVLTLGIALICLLPLLCLFIPIGIIVSLIVEQAIIAIVAEERGVISGLQRGWEVVRTNPGPMAVMWLVLNLAIRGVGSLILGMPLVIFLAPLLIGTIAETEQALTTGAIISGICVIAYLPFLIVLSGILNSYVSSGWTLTFLRLTKPEPSEMLLDEPQPIPEPAS